MDVARLTAPAKLTLSLRVTGLRGDGYHLLDAEMATVDLCDTLDVTTGSASLADPAPLAGSASLAVRMAGPAGRLAADPAPLAGPGNLVARALDAVGRRASVGLVKRIPPGAGLGGGSADAAAVLRWAGCDDPATAAALGADVPFCLVGGRARVEGIGERVAPLAFVARSFTLVLLPFGVSTAAVYRAWDQLALPRETGPGPTGHDGEVDELGVDGELGVNDLEQAATLVEPRLAGWRRHLRALTGRRPMLAGSGSTWWFEGAPHELGLADGAALHYAGETGLVVATRTVPAAAEVPPDGQRPSRPDGRRDP